MKNICSIRPEQLGSADFRTDYNAKYCYLAGAMYKGIASKEMVVAMANAGYMSFFGAGGLSSKKIIDALDYIQNRIRPKSPYGINLLCNLLQPEQEDKVVSLATKYGIRHIEAAAYMEITPSLVRYRLSGLENINGSVQSKNFILAKISRPEVAQAFMNPAPRHIVDQLVNQGTVSTEQALWSRAFPMADDICVESDSGGHTDQSVAFALLPAIQNLRDRIMSDHNYAKRIRVGAAGGIGSPEAAAAAFVMGADFIMTGSINQCTVEAGTSEQVKDLLQKINVQDTTYAPAGDMFEIGAKVQVVKKGVFFPARANKLYELYIRHGDISEIEPKIQEQIQSRYFKKSFDEVWSETKSYYIRSGKMTDAQLEESPKQKMALIFRWYFIHASRLAMSGNQDQRVDYQIHCGPAMGSFNQWVKGSNLEHWKNRYVETIANKIMSSTAQLLSNRLYGFAENSRNKEKEEL